MRQSGITLWVAFASRRDTTLTRRDTSREPALWTPAIWNMRRPIIAFVREAELMAADITQEDRQTAALLVTFALHLCVWTAVVNVWAATLSLAANRRRAN